MKNEKNREWGVGSRNLQYLLPTPYFLLPIPFHSAFDLLHSAFDLQSGAHLAPGNSKR
jgi:hypothetical protein